MKRKRVTLKVIVSVPVNWEREVTTRNIREAVEHRCGPNADVYVNVTQEDK